ncbi:MAG TPA: hypothetical protein VK655_13010 [Solirubrobacteraceae bacterium]|jgi:hypothetical protein|nr:hypothetical protein [Solirubrobacteraceae bacterium]
MSDELASWNDGPAKKAIIEQRIEQDQARVALDDREVRDVVVADLVQALDDLEQAALGAQLRLPPQARLDRVISGGWAFPARAGRCS